jgi:hypothetical protein
MHREQAWCKRGHSPARRDTARRVSRGAAPPDCSACAEQAGLFSFNERSSRGRRSFGGKSQIELSAIG